MGLPDHIPTKNKPQELSWGLHAMQYFCQQLVDTHNLKKRRGAEYMFPVLSSNMKMGTNTIGTWKRWGKGGMTSETETD